MTAAGRSSTETEIKIPVPDLAPVRASLESAGALAISPMHDESNTLYDDANGSLQKAGCALRLRRARGACRLTFKSRARFDGAVKSRDEFETEVADGAALEKILEGLGLQPRFRYEKRREEFEFSDCVVALDETPIGSFIEVEGSPEQIRVALSRLALEAADAVLESYAGLYRKAREKNPQLPADMLFSP